MADAGVQLPSCRLEVKKRSSGEKPVPFGLRKPVASTSTPFSTSSAITENTRAAYPIDFIANAKLPCTAGHPRNVIFLTCDASGVLPPVSRLSHEQAMYH
ncbi:phosphoenolpyruvate carboxykinase (ATP), partial [bacterium]|nr:phosphoenolpyruvate carboxykinase (ATP) [bacterium]